jgi:putative hydrolase
VSNDEPGHEPEGSEPDKDKSGPESPGNQPGKDENQPQKPQDQPPNPFAGTPFEMFGAMQGAAGAGMPPGFDLNALFSQVQSMMTWQGGPINWELATQTARQTIREAGDASLTADERTTVDQTVRLADHWLDEATSLPAASAGTAEAWNRGEWLDATLPAWQKLVNPLAEHIVKALGRAIPAEAAPMAGQLGDMFTQIGGLMFGIQVGQGLGQLATEVFGATDIGIPLSQTGKPVLLPANVKAFGEGLGLSDDDVRLYLALREGAHQRLFHHAPWLTAELFSAVEDYARGMQVDLSKLQDLSGQIDMSNPEALQSALGSGLLEPEETPAQRAALARLETRLALVEGWVDDVVTQATADRMPSALSLREAVRRRRAVGGPAEQTFATLVGLELRPRRLRDAANVWAALRDAHGVSGRDAPWTHPDLLPSGEDLDDPLGFVERRTSGADLDFDISDLGFDDDTSESGKSDESDESDEGGESGERKDGE